MGGEVHHAGLVPEQAAVGDGARWVHGEHRESVSGLAELQAQLLTMRDELGLTGYRFAFE